MNKISLFLMILALTVSLLTGCGDIADGRVPPASAGSAAAVPHTMPQTIPGTAPTGQASISLLPTSPARG